MLTALSKSIRDTSILRRLLFAWSNLPKELPDAWKLTIEFATKDKGDCETERTTLKLLLENLESLDPLAFESDQSLYLKLLQFPSDEPLGVVLMPPQANCLMCGNKLLLRKDRLSHVVVYCDTIGTIAGSHYHKTCTNRGCGYTQYYGYYTKKGSTDVYFNSDWASLPYFASSRDTFLSIGLMQRWDVEILLGQISFKQCADIYNEIHKYNSDQEPRYVVTYACS